MTLPTFLEPVHARITLPAVFAVCYACYHWWRWRMMHPKIVLKNLPKPAPRAESVLKPGSSERPKPQQRAKDAVPGKTPARHDAGKTERPAAARPNYRRGVSRWQAFREQEMAKARFEFDAYDADSHLRAYCKARSNQPEYFVRLGEYAWRRGAMVETHFWLSMAKFNGVEGLDEWIAAVRTRWIQSGRPTEEDNVYDQFPFERGVLAHTYLMVVCGFSVAIGRESIADMARDEAWDAQLILQNLRPHS